MQASGILPALRIQMPTCCPYAIVTGNQFHAPANSGGSELEAGTKLVLISGRWKWSRKKRSERWSC
ncbi:hypothetical protein BRADI_1g37456v3 [Brachypodium distachyon]|uniref:Uncharacterized protein n=1 Tax=Brachypodium distachyon TaxID=15368 RepID=A0A2K2DN67_BRADI|nr:hypothetical protein BRADI_1g37456v3 [Brachypodium distachyon]